MHVYTGHVMKELLYSISLVSTQEEDSGLYSVQAVNSEGTAISQASINVVIENQSKQPPPVAPKPAIVSKSYSDVAHKNKKSNRGNV